MAVAGYDRWKSTSDYNEWSIEEIPVFDDVITRDEELVEAALRKLTPAERKLLGH